MGKRRSRPVIESNNYLIVKMFADNIGDAQFDAFRRENANRPRFHFETQSTTFFNHFFNEFYFHLKRKMTQQRV